MNRFLITAIIVLLITGNQANAQEKETDPKIIQQKMFKEDKDVEKARKWIISVVASTLNKANGLEENTNEEAEGKHKEIYTNKYLAYKNDAVEVDMDGGMTLKAFQKKWTKDFDYQYAGVGNGYLVSDAYYGFIKVTHCVFKKKIGAAYMFETIITDTDAKIDYKRDLKIIRSGNAFLIEDVLEYN